MAIAAGILSKKKKDCCWDRSFVLAERSELKPERDACGCFVEHVHGQSGQAFDVSLNSISYHEQSPSAVKIASLSFLICT